MPKKQMLWAVGAVGTVSVIVAISLTMGKSHAEEGKNDKNAAPRLEFAAADLTEAKVRPLDRAIPVTGELKALNHAMIKSKIAAVVKSVLVREGEQVHAGQVLATFDPNNIAAQLHEQQGNLEVAKAQLALDEKTHAKNQTLLKQGFISENAFDTSYNSVAISRAKLKAAEAQVEVAADAFNDTVLRAPISGTIGKRSIQPGEKVEINSDLLSIVDLSEMELQVAVPTTDIASVKVGQVAQFHVDGFGDATYEGRVKRINPEAEVNSRAITVFLSVKNPSGTLRGGMFAKGYLALGKSNPIMTLPIAAVLDGAGQPYVYWIDQGKVARANLTLGSSDERSGLVEIKSGLPMGALVVATKLDTVKPGTLAVIHGKDDAKAAPAAKGKG
ncbi:MAG: efflux RND transporter periplasmic adaptor subunit [Burkholderiales bacterium]|nr:efflux RND transporter periplasmic adaptor subunit [Burkholderiales bacterium]